MRKVLITGGRGMLGSSILEAGLKATHYEFVSITRADVDLRDYDRVSKLLADISPDIVIHTAARVGGIAANIAGPTEFLADNLRIDTAVIEGARDSGVQDFLYFGSSCMYPRDYRQPLVEGDVLAAPLEPTNEGYALAKIAGARLCQYVSDQHGLNYKVLIPSNLYGPGDDYTAGKSHLVASALVKAHEAKLSSSPSIDVWGDGTARREFTYVGDVASWTIENLGDISSWPALMNLGIGLDYSVAEYYRFALEVVGAESNLVFDSSKPAGMRQKLMDSSLAAEHGWAPKTSILDGMARAYGAFLENRTS